MDPKCAKAFTETWWSEQLGELLTALSTSDGVKSARIEAVKRAVQAIDADFGAIISRGAAVANYGLPEDEAVYEELSRAAMGPARTIYIPGAGGFHTAFVTLNHGKLMLGRRDVAFTHEEVAQVATLARLLDIVLRVERRSNLLEQLGAVQEAISNRASLDEVFQTIVEAAGRLLDIEMVAIRVADSDDPSRMGTPAAIGHPPELLQSLRYGPVAGATAAAPDRGELTVVDDYQNAPRARPEAVAYGVTTSMAVPLHEQGTVIGSLAVSSRERGRRFSLVDQEMLSAFAEHASLALAAARAGDTLRQALTDPLTGLANRNLFLDRLEHALARSARNAAAVTVIFIDLDRFKLVNDTLGHAAGDALLVEVAARIRGCLRRAETAARFGGDEFAILLEDAADELAAAHVAERIAAALREPFDIADRELFTSASIGIALGTSEEPEELLRNADVAMYRAKTLGKNRCEIFEPEMHSDVMDRLKLESELRNALETNQLEVHFQPAFHLVTGEPTGLEALVRWRHPERGLLPPAVFIPLAEETGLILQLGSFVLGEACRQAAAWQDRYPGMRVAVNLSGWELNQPDIVEKVDEAMKRWNVPDEILVLELTETILMHDTEATITKLHELKALGTRLAIDDFGTGYSSLRYLQRFPLDVLKIPKPFVDELVDESGGVLAGVILDLSARLGLNTVAEGIETAEQAARLRELGCPLAQGYLFARPMPIEDLLELLDDGVAVTT
ncbi:MAG TPA: EAL domain-containing protein [Thermoleophilaceae bacterium]